MIPSHPFISPNPPQSSLNSSAQLHSPVGLLLLVVEVPVRLLQFIGQYLQIPRQLVLGLEFLGQQHQISCGVVQWNVTDEQPLPETERIKDMSVRLCGGTKYISGCYKKKSIFCSVYFQLRIWNRGG